MLDSLVRVSRRVRGAADLLATEMQAVPVKDTRYTSLLSYPPGPKLGTRGLRPEGYKLHPRPQSSPSGSLRERAEKCCHREPSPPRRVLADPRRSSRAHVSLNLRPRLRERLCLPLHSFTYS
jgi:hypothetical protein